MSKFGRFVSWGLLLLGALFMNVSSAGAQMIVAHRGASHEAPENTLAAFRLAWEKGADAIEGDFYLTADRKIVCIHDKSTKRTASVDLPVAESTCDELKSIDVGSWKDPKYAGEKIPTLEQVLEIVPRGKVFLIEIKCGQEIVPVLKKTLEKSDIDPSQLRIICFNSEVIAASKKAMPHIKAYWLTSFKQDEQTKIWQPTIKQILRTLKKTKSDGLDSQAEPEVVDRNLVNNLQELGYEYHVWTVNDPDQARYFSKLGVESITTDRPAFIRKAIESTSTE